MSAESSAVPLNYLSPSGISWLGLLGLVAVVVVFLFWRLRKVEAELKDTRARLASQLDVQDYQALCNQHFATAILPDLQAMVDARIRDGVMSYLAEAEQEESESDQCTGGVCLPIFMSVPSEKAPVKVEEIEPVTSTEIKP